MKILIYGYGYIGKACYDFVQRFFDEVFIFDDFFSEIIENEKFIKSPFEREFDLILVCLSSKKLYEKIATKLNIKFSKSIIKFAPFLTSAQSENFLKFIEDKFDKNFIIDFNLKAIISYLDELKQEYFEFKKNVKSNRISQIINSKYPDLDTFQKLLKTSLKQSKKDIINYPGFSVKYDVKCKDRNFYFIDNIDFESLKKRNKRLILLFGNSAVRNDWDNDKTAISDFLKIRLKDDIVLNLGVSAATLFEQICYFNALFYELHPDIVISIFGGTDHLNALLSDEILLKRHNIFYDTSFEIDAKDALNSILTLKSQDIYISDLKNLNSNEDIAKAVFFRLIQFKNIVCSAGGKFYAFLQPFLSKKQHLSKSEMSIKNDRISCFAGMNSNNFIDIFNNLAKDMDYFWDLNSIIQSKRGGCFLNTWLHCTPYANEIIADFISQKIKE